MDLARGRLLFLCVTFGASICLAAGATDPVLSTPDLKDKYGNTANSTSDISWGKNSTNGQAYKTDLAYDDGGLGPLYMMMHGFLNTIQPGDFPSELISSTVKDFSSVMNDPMKLVMTFLGITLCFVIGILFMVVMPIVGCCFCCCRTCCNKCGGKKLQKFNKNNNCKKVTFTVLNLVCTLIILAGAGCMYVTNDQMSKAVAHFGPAIENNLEDLPIFVNNTVGAIEKIALGGFKFTSDVAVRDLESLGYLLGIPTRNALKANIGLDSVLKAVEDFETVIDTVGADMVKVNASQVELKANGTLLENDLNSVKTKVDAAKAASCTTTCSPAADSTQLAMEANFDALPDITAQMVLLEGVQSQDLSQNVREGRQEFEEIPWTVQNDTEKMSTDIRSSMTSVYNDIDSALSSLSDIKKEASSFVDPLKGDISSLMKPASDYDKYRWMAGIGLACLVAFIALLQVMGLIFGAFGTCSDTPPTERGCIATCGGNCLMAASGFIFIFSWLLMLLLSLFFFVGGNVQVFVCKPLTDPEMKFMDILEGDGGLVQSGYLLPGMLFGDATIVMPLKGVLQSCKGNQAAMLALQLYRKFDIEDALDWKKHVDIAKEINGISVDFSGVNVLTPSMEKQLTDFAAAVDIDYQGFVDELSKDTTKADLTTFSADLRTLHTANTAAGFDTAANELDTVHSGIYKTVKTEEAQLLADVLRLNSSTQNVNSTVEGLLKATRDVETYLQTSGTDIVKQQAKAFQNRLEKVIDSFVGHANDSIFNDVGKCLPVYNLYESMVGISLCKYTIDSLNGFWFALGMSLFFMIPSLIFNVKLAKHFRRMKYSEELDRPSVDPVEKFVYPKPNTKEPIFASNKVAPQWYF